MSTDNNSNPNIRKKRWHKPTLLIAFYLMLILTLLYAIWPYSIRNYRGDGVITDDGMWSLRPRFLITFDPITISEPGKHTFHFSKLPSIPLTLTFPIDDNGDNSTPISLTTHFDVQITSGGIIIAQASDELHDWTTSLSIDESVLWHPDLRDMTLPSNEPITLTIVVTNVDPASPNLTVRPTFRGGGIELP